MFVIDMVHIRKKSENKSTTIIIIIYHHYHFHFKRLLVRPNKKNMRVSGYSLKKIRVDRYETFFDFFFLERIYLLLTVKKIRIYCKTLSFIFFIYIAKHCPLYSLKAQLFFF